MPWTVLRSPAHRRLMVHRGRGGVMEGRSGGNGYPALRRAGDRAEAQLGLSADPAANRESRETLART